MEESKEKEVWQTPIVEELDIDGTLSSPSGINPESSVSSGAS